MLRLCDEHGYFRGEKCPTCEEKGKFLMNEEELERLGRIMAGILRHFPDRYGLTIDDKGWVDVARMVDEIRHRRKQFHWLRPHHIEAVAVSDPKGRYQVKDGYVRATYGHSIDVEPDLPTENIPDKLYYPTSEEEAEILLETGLKPSDRRKVHLSLTAQAAYDAGIRRVEEPIILQIDAKAAIEGGHVISRAGPTVFVTDEVLPEYLSISNEVVDRTLPEDMVGEGGEEGS